MNQSILSSILLLGLGTLVSPFGPGFRTLGNEENSKETQSQTQSLALESFPADPYCPPPDPPNLGPAGEFTVGAFVSRQVNVTSVKEIPFNVLGDAANEPSIAVDPTDPNKMVIGWRQFDNVACNFRQAGWAYSQDGGTTWSPSVRSITIQGLSPP